ncbi:MAG: radical SAM peptide maturase [Draconibacterium sp.]|nr:radical SAM peptide maturase [Draconibacterium sp.]
MKNDSFMRISNDIIEDQIKELSQLVFEVTDSCNLKCKYCGYGEFYEDHDERANQSLPVEKAIRLLDYLKKFWQSNRNNSYSQQVYISFYGGEPLLNMGFIRRIVAYVELLKIPMKKFAFSMTTNAMLLHKHIDYLIEKDFRLLISLDGNEKNHSYRVTHSGDNSFKKVFHNVQLVKQKNPKFFESNINFNSVLHNRNNVEEVHEFIKKEFGKKPRIAELNSMGIREAKKELFTETYRNKYESLHQSENYEEIQNDLFIESPDIQQLGIFLHHYSGNVFRSYNDLLFDNDRKDILPTGTCLPFKRKMFVTVTGKILPCERIGHQFTLGQVTNTGVILDFEEIAARYNTWFSKLIPQCSRCHNTKACVQCIFNLDDLDAKPVCKGFMKKEILQRYVGSQMEYLGKNPHLYQKIMDEVIIR